MQEDIYDSPKSKLVGENSIELGESKRNEGFESVMTIAALIFCAIEFVFGGLSFLEVGKYGALNIVVGMAFNVVAVVFVIYFVRLVRAGTAASKSNELVVKNIGVWGYLWRAIVVKYFSFFSSIILITIFTMTTSYSLPEQSLIYTAVYSLLMFPVYVFSAWLFFSSDRRWQFQWVLTLFRGF